MTRLESNLKENNAWVKNPTTLQANEMFQLSQTCLGLSSKTPKNRDRRVGQMKWTTVAKEMRRANQD